MSLKAADHKNPARTSSRLDWFMLSEEEFCQKHLFTKAQKVSYCFLLILLNICNISYVLCVGIQRE